jgi:two-component system, chemotaxis family, protein-glutamate methylesterase/glutaminase
MPKIRVLVVEDSITMRRYLCDVLSADPAIDVVAEAADGKEAISRCQSLRPDLVTMDMMLPVMTGLSATEYIMAHCPTPILIVSSSTNRRELFKTYEALAAGAVDVLEKPLGNETDGAWEQRFRSAVKLVARIRVVTHVRARLGTLGRRGPAAPPMPVADRAPSNKPYEVVAIGASTGGPGAVLDILRTLSPGFPLPILLVLHLSEVFATALAEWLDSQTAIRVSYAQEGDLVAARAGRVTIAPPDCHLEVRHGRLHLSSEPPRHSCRPSVDVLFESVARDCGAAAIACLLTGMGRDGAAGMLEIRRAGGVTIAQDEESSIVYGMPREAMRLGAATRELGLAEIGAVLTDLARQATRTE